MWGHGSEMLCRWELQWGNALPWGGLCCICLWIVSRCGLIVCNPRVTGRGTWVWLHGHVLHNGVCVSVCFDLLSFLEHGFLHGDDVNGPWGWLREPLKHLNVALELFKGMGMLAPLDLAARWLREGWNVVGGILDLGRG